MPPHPLTSSVICRANRGRLRQPHLAVWRAAAGIVGGWLALAGCSAVPPTLGATAAEARANSEALFGALAVRFHDVQRAPKFQHARARLSRHALSPSGVFRDTSVWTSPPRDDLRTLMLAGTATSAGYAFVPRATVPTPSIPGDSRHSIQLARLADDEYEWVTDVDHAIGTARAAEVASAITAFLGAPEGRAGAQLRAGYRAAFPRTTSALAQLFSLDSLHVVHSSDRTSAVSVRFSVHPDRLRPSKPQFAKYLDKYVEPARLRLALRDPAGGTWLDVRFRDNRAAVRYRVRDGRLVPLAGPARSMPDSLQLHADFSAKFSIFRVGVTDLVGDFVVLRSSDERGWAMRFRREPDWHFPLAVNHLIRTALRRPFEGHGMTLRIAVGDSAGAQTLLTRRARVVVEEGAIVRWLGGLGSSAVSDFAGKAEAEENRYVYEVLSALRGDFVAALGGGE